MLMWLLLSQRFYISFHFVRLLKLIIRFNFEINRSVGINSVQKLTRHVLIANNFTRAMLCMNNCVGKHVYESSRVDHHHTRAWFIILANSSLVRCKNIELASGSNSIQLLLIYKTYSGLHRVWLAKKILVSSSSNSTLLQSNMLF